MEKYKNNISTYKNNAFEVSAPTWNYDFELPDRSYSVSPIKMYINIIESRITFKIKSEYYLEFLTSKIMKSL